MKILIFPYAKAMRDGRKHPKNYPWWPELISKLQMLGHTLIQVGIEGEPQLIDDFRKNLSLTELSNLIKESDTWFGVDSFPQHLCWDLGVKGMVIFGQSDPNIFGHPENINILKSRNYLREQQFFLWEQTEANDACFTSPNEIIKIFQTHFDGN